MKAESFINPYIEELLRFAKKEGERLVKDCCIPGARYVIGGSLGYKALLRGNYDIDLRLLLPENENVRGQIDLVRDILSGQAANDKTFTTRLIDEGGTNYIQHTKRFVKVEGIPDNPDVELSWNIQSEASYRSISELSARMPGFVIDNFVIAKGVAKEESQEAYKKVKEQWKAMIKWMLDSGARGMNNEEFHKILEKAKGQYPLFWSSDFSVGQ